MRPEWEKSCAEGALRIDSLDDADKSGFGTARFN
jgi:hypothetical protein